jgi:hypothetical protein
MKSCVTSAVLLTAFAAVTSTLSVGAAHDAGAPLRRGCALTSLRDFVDCMRSSHSRERSHRRSWVSGSSGKTLLYASEPFDGAVSILSVGPKGLTPVGNLTFNSYLPIGIAVDASQNLYVPLVPLAGEQGAVDVFPRGATKPSRVYTKGLAQPEYVTVDSQGTVYVANFSDTSGDCTVVEYAKHSMKPTDVISGIPGCIDGMTVDSSLNLYVTYVAYPSSGGVQSDVLKYAPGSKRGAPLNLKAPGGNLFWGVAVGAKNDIIVMNDQEIGTINQILVFPSGSTSPTKTVQYGLGWYPEYFALQGDRFFAPAFMVNELAPGVVPSGEPAEFAFPGGRELLVESPKLLNPGYYFGYAVSP